MVGSLYFYIAQLPISLTAPRIYFLLGVEQQATVIQFLSYLICRLNGVVMSWLSIGLRKMVSILT